MEKCLICSREFSNKIALMTHVAILHSLKSYEYKEKFNLDGTLRERDLRRQEEIKKTYPGFKFLRINAETKEITIVE